WALTLISNVYIGLAERAMEIAIGHCHRATSIAIPAGTVAHHPQPASTPAPMPSPTRPSVRHSSASIPPAPAGDPSRPLTHDGDTVNTPITSADA
ncbi:MAG: hypothetical protein ABIR68_10560, partial [Ilumatobacteraceae bacterium]